MKIRSAALSDIGRVRRENEDSFLCDESLALFGVADGIGGLPRGALASQTAVSEIMEWFKAQGFAASWNYAACLAQVNERVFRLGRVLSPRNGIGTTLTFIHVVGGNMNLIHVGDSTLYRLRDGVLDVLTTEHNVDNEIRARQARGETFVPFGENRGALTRCVGQPPPLEGDITAIPHQAGDRVLICSDGITRYILPLEITRVLAQGADPAEICRTLVDRANECGGIDNSTAVTVFFD